MRSVNLTRAWKASVLLMEQILATYAEEREHWEQRRSGSGDFVKLRRELRLAQERVATAEDHTAVLVAKVDHATSTSSPHDRHVADAHGGAGPQVGRLEAAEAKAAKPEVGGEWTFKHQLPLLTIDTLQRCLV